MLCNARKVSFEISAARRGTQNVFLQCRVKSKSIWKKLPEGPKLVKSMENSDATYISQTDKTLLHCGVTFFPPLPKFLGNGTRLISNDFD